MHWRGKGSFKKSWENMKKLLKNKHYKIEVANSLINVVSKQLKILQERNRTSNV